ncbi:hypothetical protein EX30DRAFT_350933 [Ascodesmis nigricans]|uniref:Uncharacterized protein n=1 Tax=Ascodesmis nigricans TaxID=341454 RepID=A0A4S2MSB6_9PEZI|nr:hypothetical protein EX30DRAFT_350933 [Ascodesmis nigricans]
MNPPSQQRRIIQNQQAAINTGTSNMKHYGNIILLQPTTSTQLHLISPPPSPHGPSPRPRRLSYRLNYPATQDGTCLNPRWDSRRRHRCYKTTIIIVTVATTTRERGGGRRTEKKEGYGGVRGLHLLDPAVKAAFEDSGFTLVHNPTYIMTQNTAGHKARELMPFDAAEVEAAGDDEPEGVKWDQGRFSLLVEWVGEDSAFYHRRDARLDV